MKLIDMMIQNQSFCEFIDQLIKIQNDEQEEKTIWDLWLHKVFDESFADFKKKLIGTKEETINKEEIEATVNESFNMLNGFVPGVIENDGIVSSAGRGCG